MDLPWNKKLSDREVSPEEKQKPIEMVLLGRERETCKVDSGPTKEKFERDQNLRYSKIEKISLRFFVQESFSFASNFYIEKIPFLLGFLLFNLNKDIYSTEMFGFIYQYTTLFGSLMYDFQEPIGIILGPYYSKGDHLHYKLFKWRLCMINFFFFILCALLCFAYRPLYKMINLEEDKLDEFSKYSIIMYFTIYLTSSIQNFLKGRVSDSRAYSICKLCVKQYIGSSSSSDMEFIRF